MWTYIYWKSMISKQEATAAEVNANFNWCGQSKAVKHIQ